MCHSPKTPLQQSQYGTRLQGRVDGNLTVYSSALNITMTGAAVIRTVPAVRSGRPRQS
jgi:hypothetical protein